MSSIINNLFLSRQRRLGTDQPAPTLHHKIRSRAYFDALLARLGLTVSAEFQMYYWLVDGGSPNRIMRAIFARLGAGALYAVDRLALTLGLENRHPEHVLSRAKMLVVTRAAAAASGLRNRGSES